MPSSFQDAKKTKGQYLFDDLQTTIEEIQELERRLFGLKITRSNRAKKLQTWLNEQQEAGFTAEVETKGDSLE